MVNAEDRKIRFKRAMMDAISGGIRERWNHGTDRRASSRQERHTSCLAVPSTFAKLTDSSGGQEMNLLWRHVAPARRTQHHPLSETTRQTILCVDDDPLISAAIARILGSHGVDVISAYSGPHGYWRLVTERPDLVIADLSMPNGDGAELVYCMRSNKATAGIPVIVMTGVQDERVRNRLEGMGVSAYLQKPVTASSLLCEIQRHLPLQAEIRHGQSERSFWN